MKKLLFILWGVLLSLPITAQKNINYLRNIPNYKAEDLGENINSKYDESYPVVSPDGKILYFTREGHPQNIDYRDDKRDQDIWFATMAGGGTWSLAKNIGKPINEGYRSLVNAPNINSLIVWGAPQGYTGVKISKRTTDGWTNPENFYRHKIKKSDKSENIFVGNDLQTMLLSRDGDIFVVFKQTDGTWSDPQTLGTTINTSKKESVAFLAPDNVTLYFASMGHAGFGGIDLFLSRRLDDSWQKWSKPINLGPSINTKDNESGLYLPASGEYAYFHREGRRRNRDIFRVKLHEKLRPTPVVLITGRVLDAKTKKPVGTAISYRHLAKNVEVGASSSDPKNGTYEVALPAGHKYGYFASKKGYYPIGENIDLTGLKKYKEVKVDLFVTPIEKGVKILLNNLFFAVSSSTIKSTSYNELDRLIKTLKEYPKMVIQLNGHTDNRGSVARNRILSESRAFKVRSYLKTRGGIKESRIKIKGMGSSQPIADNNTEEGRVRNRRVEFEVLDF
jgi:outer membrane protein OmpA-like peptidoglycan-associated protein